MDKLLGVIVAAIGLIFVLPLVGILVGAFSGWVVGLFFADTILGFLAAIGVKTAGLAMWQVGAAMGFLGGFIRTTVSRA